MGLGEARAERDALLSRKRQIDTRLAAINHRIRGNRLPPAEYESLGQEQTALKAEIHSIEVKATQLKRVIHEMSQSEHGFSALWDRVRGMEATLGSINAKLDKILAILAK
jgi:septation ring formation regulator EzrA